MSKDRLKSIMWLLLCFAVGDIVTQYLMFGSIDILDTFLTMILVIVSGLLVFWILILKKRNSIDTKFIQLLCLPD